MRLCIADPPYLGRAAIWYGDKMSASLFHGSGAVAAEVAQGVLDLNGGDAA